MEALAASPVFGFKTSRSLKLSRPNFTLPGFTHLSCTGYKGSTSNFGTFLSWSPKSCSIFASADIPIMVNDCSGKMGLAVAEAAVEAGLQLVPFCLTGPGMGQNVVHVKNVQIQVHGTSEKEAILDKVLEMYPGVIIADYTLPSAVNENAEFYSRRGVPFVMGTTGGDRERLSNTVRDSGVYAVIAPQMGKQVVAFQAAMEIMAQEFPGAFAGYKLKVTESHQSSKVDTSGTARAIVASFNKLGVSFKDEEIEMVRNPPEQISRMEVPEEHLRGHAFHTYSLASPDGMYMLSTSKFIAKNLSSFFCSSFTQTFKWAAKNQSFSILQSMAVMQ